MPTDTVSRNENCRSVGKNLIYHIHRSIVVFHQFFSKNQNCSEHEIRSNELTEKIQLFELANIYYNNNSTDSDSACSEFIHLAY